MHIVLERWWIRDGFCPPDVAWRAVIVGTGLGITSAADETPWRAIARAGAYLALKRCGVFEPMQAQEPLEALVARAQLALAFHASIVCVRTARPRTGARRRPAAAGRSGR